MVEFHFPANAGVEFVVDQAAHQMPAELGRALRHARLRCAEAFVGGAEILRHADRKSWQIVEKENQPVIVVDHNRHCGFCLVSLGADLIEFGEEWRERHFPLCTRAGRTPMIGT